MEKAQSKECAAEQGTYNLSAQDAVNDFNILRRLAENGGPVAVSEYIDESINRWKKGTSKVRYNWLVHHWKIYVH
jgi:hypothetical protein